MNIVLFEPKDFAASNEVVISGRRHRHLKDILRVEPEKTLRVGVLGGQMGAGRVLEIDDTSARLEVVLNEEPPAPSSVRLIVALPRPKVFRKLVSTITCLGIKEIHFVNAYKVEKVYWSCEQIQPDEIRKAAILGLEQSRDTRLPEIHFHRRLKPFAQDTLPQLISGRKALIAHPAAQNECPRNLEESCYLAVGPEGGFIDYEIGLFEEAGFTPVTLGSRILTVEMAVTSLVSRLA